MRKESWTESDVLALPKGESDYFERKSGVLFSNERNLRETLGKALSAFANSGGGHIVLGIDDNNEIDGVPEIFKGRQRTREWLERVVPYLVAVPLQDFRIHEVVADTPSKIPDDRVVIVIDVEDSKLAPHQDIHTKYYFHRSGSNSHPAPHHLLELLWSREKYPSGKIAHAWLNFVISPLLATLAHEATTLNDGTLDWDRITKELKSLKSFYVVEGELSANQIQFLDAYPDVKSELEAHDAKLKALTHEVLKLAYAIQDHEVFRRTYQRSIDDASLDSIRSENSAVMSFGGNADMLASLFGNMSESERLALLAQHVINADGDLNRHDSVWPLWNRFKSDFIAIWKEPQISRQQQRVHDALTKLLAVVNNLISTVTTIRRELAHKYGEVFEDETLQYGIMRFYNPSSNEF